MALSPDELRAQITGLLSFPVTPMTADGDVDVPRFREHLRYLVGHKPNALFVCGGTGEFFSLTPGEYAQLVSAAVEEVDGRMPVVAGVGYGTRLATEYAQTAQQAGVDGLLVLPPYLVQAEQEGLYEHYRAVAESTKLGVILYQRDNVTFDPETVRRLSNVPQIVGLKDGRGEMERLLRIGLAVDDDFALMNGMPTAELSALAFNGLGIGSYSSAVFNFVPEIAWAFFKAVRDSNLTEANRLLDGFYRPFGELRDRARGYAVSLIKAGVGARLNPVGPARTPLANPTAECEAELKWIIERGVSLVGG